MYVSISILCSCISRVVLLHPFQEGFRQRWWENDRLYIWSRDSTITRRKIGHVGGVDPSNNTNKRTHTPTHESTTMSADPTTQLLGESNQVPLKQDDKVEVADKNIYDALKGK